MVSNWDWRWRPSWGYELYSSSSSSLDLLWFRVWWAPLCQSKEKDSYESCDLDDIVGSRGWRWLEDSSQAEGRGSHELRHVVSPRLAHHNMSAASKHNRGCSALKCTSNLKMVKPQLVGPLVILWLIQFITGNSLNYVSIPFSNYNLLQLFYYFQITIYSNFSIKNREH